MAAQETTTPQPKERIIFDAYSYYGTEGENMAVEDIMERDDLTEEEVREQYSEEEIFDRAMEMRETDYEEETDALIGWFDGQTPGFTPAITDENSDWYGGGDNVFADCEIQKIWDENGHLFLTGAHHDGSVSVELRQLTNDGAEAYESIKDAADAWTTENFTINGRSYDGGDQSILQAIRDLWDDPDLAEVPRYMEKAFGCPAEEYEEPEHPKEQAQAFSLSAEAKSARDSSMQLAQTTGNTAPIHETAR